MKRNWNWICCTQRGVRRTRNTQNWFQAIGEPHTHMHSLVLLSFCSFCSFHRLLLAVNQISICANDDRTRPNRIGEKVKLAVRLRQEQERKKKTEKRMWSMVGRDERENRCLTGALISLQLSFWKWWGDKNDAQMDCALWNAISAAATIILSHTTLRLSSYRFTCRTMNFNCFLPICQQSQITLFAGRIKYHISFTISQQFFSDFTSHKPSIDIYFMDRRRRERERARDLH